MSVLLVPFILFECSARAQKFGDLEVLSATQVCKETALSLLQYQRCGHLRVDSHVFGVLKLVQNHLLMNLSGEVALQRKILLVISEKLHSLNVSVVNALFHECQLVLPLVSISVELLIVSCNRSILISDCLLDSSTQPSLGVSLLHLIINLQVIISNDPL